MHKFPVSYFLDVFLQSPAASIPKGSLWVLYIADPESILPAIDLAYQGEPQDKQWNTNSKAKILLADNLQKTGGCMFCQAIEIPGEGSTPIAEGNIKYNSFIRGYVGAGRNDFPLMRASFLETNVSFADSFLRGWALATAKFGMLARDGSDKNYRTNLTCLKYITTPGGPILSKTINFYRACCVSVDNQELNYDHVSVAVKRNAQFIYDSYSMDTVNEF